MNSRSAGRLPLRALGEVVLIVVGVLIALALDSWARERDLDAGAEAARTALIAEVEANLAELRDMELTVAARLERLRALVIANDRPFSSLTPSFGGYRTPDLSDAAWQIARSEPVIHRLPPDFIAGAFELYQVNRALEGLGEQVSRLTFGEINVVPEKATVARDIAIEIMQQQVVWSRLAIEMHEQFLAGHVST